MSLSPEPLSPAEELRSLRLRDIQRHIQRYYREIQAEIEAIGKTVAGTLKRQEEEYLTAFQLQIGKVREEVRVVRVEMERQADAFNTDLQLQRLRQVTKELDREANRLAARVQQGREQTMHWKLRSQELEAETNHLIRQNLLLRRRLETLSPEKRRSEDFSPPLNTSTKASNTPCVRSGDYEAQGYFAVVVGELVRKYAVTDPDFIRDMEEAVSLLQKPLKSTIRHLKQTLEHTQKQVKRRMQGSDAHNFHSPDSSLHYGNVQLPTDISRILSPRRTPALSSFRVSLTPSGQGDLLCFESNTTPPPQESKGNAPIRRLRKRPVVTKGKLLLAPEL